MRYRGIYFTGYKNKNFTLKICLFLFYKNKRVILSDVFIHPIGIIAYKSRKAREAGIERFCYAFLP